MGVIGSTMVPPLVSLRVLQVTLKSVDRSVSRQITDNRDPPTDLKSGSKIFVRRFYFYGYGIALLPFFFITYSLVCTFFVIKPHAMSKPKVLLLGNIDQYASLPDESSITSRNPRET